MEKKLYCVRVTLYVMAENASGACVAATRAPVDIFECHARKAEHVDDGWAIAIPYNAEDNRTCAEILETQKASRPSISFEGANTQQEPLIRARLHIAARPMR